MLDITIILITLPIPKCFVRVDDTAHFEKTYLLEWKQDIGDFHNFLTHNYHLL